MQDFAFVFCLWCSTNLHILCGHQRPIWDEKRLPHDPLPNKGREGTCVLCLLQGKMNMSPTMKGVRGSQKCQNKVQPIYDFEYCRQARAIRFSFTLRIFRANWLMLSEIQEQICRGWLYRKSCTLNSGVWMNMTTCNF